jgi:hypothetical protein
MVIHYHKPYDTNTIPVQKPSQDVESGRPRRHSMDELKRLTQDINTGIDSVTLKFKVLMISTFLTLQSETIEAKYRDHIFTKNIRLLRLSLICGILLFVLFVLLDLYSVSNADDLADIFFIRGITIGAISFYLLFAYLWPEILKRFYQYWIFLLGIIIGGALITIALVLESMYTPNVVLGKTALI